MKRGAHDTGVTLLPTGTCFDDANAIAARILIAGRASDARIVHGLVEILDQGDDTGQIIAHAWVEHRGQILQLHRLKGGIVMSRSTPEKFAKIFRVIESTRYTIDEAIAKKTAGPWEEKYLAHTKDKGSNQKESPK